MQTNSSIHSNKEEFDLAKGLQPFTHPLICDNNYIIRSIIMPQIIPIKDLKDTSRISEMCRNSSEPVFITKNGYGDMVMMSMELYEQYMRKLDLYRKLEEAEQDIRDGSCYDAEMAVADIRAKYNV